MRSAPWNVLVVLSIVWREDTWVPDWGAARYDPSTRADNDIGEMEQNDALVRIRVRLDDDAQVRCLAVELVPRRIHHLACHGRDHHGARIEDNVDSGRRLGSPSSGRHHDVCGAVFVARFRPVWIVDLFRMPLRSQGNSRIEERLVVGEGTNPPGRRVDGHPLCKREDLSVLRGARL